MFQLRTCVALLKDLGKCGFVGTLLFFPPGKICASDSGLLAAPDAVDDILQERIKVIGVENLRLSVSPEVEDLDPDLVNLGKELFFSKSLSGDFDVACASCHHPKLAGGDALSLPVGVAAYSPELLGPGRWHDWSDSPEPRADGGPNVSRNSPTTINSGFYKQTLFNDGRVFLMPAVDVESSEKARFRTPESNLGRFDPLAGSTLLETQTRFPMVSTEEMRGHVFGKGEANETVRESFVARLRGDTEELNNNDWRNLFRKAFKVDSREILQAIDFINIERALAAYQESQVAIDNPWQRYLAGDASALTPEAKYGAWLFLTAATDAGAGCVSCHAPPFFTDESFHNIGMPQFGRGKNADRSDYGRYQVTRDRKDRYRFRTPSLYNVEMTSPYGHTGAFVSLREIIEHHIEPERSLRQFDFAFKNNPQLAFAAHLYPDARALSQEVLESLKREQAAGESLLPPDLTLDDRQIDALESFLRALTDPCLKDEECVEKWIPALGVPPPDDHRLVAKFAPRADRQPPQEPLRSTAVGDSSALLAAGSSGYGNGALPRRLVSARLLERDECRATSSDRFRPEGEESRGSSARFSELGHSAGLTRKHSIPWQQYSLRTAQRLLFSGGMAAGDVNGDCLIDIFQSTGDGDTGVLYLNMGGRFVDVSQKWGLDLPQSDDAQAISNGAAFADLDGDGDLDLLITFVAPAEKTSRQNTTNQGAVRESMIRVLRNDGDKFRQVENSGIEAQLTAWSLSLADIDGDGDLDAMTAHWRGPGLGGPQPNHLWRSDLTGGELKFVAANADAGLSAVIGQTDFTFTPTLSDMSGNGLPDLLLAADFASSQYYRNTGRGFVRATHLSEISDENGMGSAVGDYDNDGDLDWFVSSIWDPDGHAEGNWGVTGNRLYRNEDGNFSDVTDSAGVARGYWGWGACFADFDNDMHLDLFQTTGFDLPMQLAARFGHPAVYSKLKQSMADFEKTPSMLFMSDGNGRFREIVQESGIEGLASGRAVLCFDYDRDGDLDIVVSNHQEVPYLFRNEAAAGNYLNIALAAPGSANSFAVGAKVYVTAGGITQMREVRAGGAFLAGGPPEVHFGLGEHAVVDQLRVRWPAPGAADTVFTNVPGNRSLSIARE